MSIIIFEDTIEDNQLKSSGVGFEYGSGNGYGIFDGSGCEFGYKHYAIRNGDGNGPGLGDGYCDINGSG